MTYWSSYNQPSFYLYVCVSILKILNSSYCQYLLYKVNITQMRLIYFQIQIFHWIQEE